MKYPQEYIGKHPGEIFENKIIKGKGLTLKEAASTLDVSVAYLDDFIRGNRNLWSTLANNIENQYGISASLTTLLQEKYDEKIQQL